MRLPGLCGDVLGLAARALLAGSRGCGRRNGPRGPAPQLLGPPLARRAPAASPREEEASSPFLWALPTPAACPCAPGAPGHVQRCAQRNGGGQSP